MQEKRERMLFPYVRGMTARARNLRKEMTHAEGILWERIRGRQLEGSKFTRQKPLLGYIVDFFCAELDLVVEVDGEIHTQQAEYDALRDMELEQYGATIIRYTNDQVINHLSNTLNHLSEHVCAIRSSTA